MADEAKTNRPATEQGVPITETGAAAPQTGQPATPETEGFAEAKKKSMERIEEIFGKHVSASNSELSERGYPELEKLKQKWMADFEKLFNDWEKDYRAATADMPEDRRAFILRERLDKVTAQAETQLRMMEGAIKGAKTGEQVTSNDAGAVERAVSGVKKLMDENPAVQETGLKLTEGKNRADDLTPQDYLNVIGLLKPYDVSSGGADSKTAFEATAGGALVGLMSPEQRYRLMQSFMDSGRRGETVQVLDGFLSTGMLSRVQGEALMKEAVAKGVMTQQQFDADFRTKLEQGYYDAEVRKYRELVRSEDLQKYSGNYSDNIMNRVVGRPLVGGLLALWGAILTALNIAANWHNKKEIPKSYAMVGVAGIIAGTEIATGTMQKQKPWFGAGVVSGGLDKLGGSSEEAKNSFENQTRGKVADIILNAPAPLAAYLDKGGYATMMQLRAEKSQKGEQPLVSVDELIEREKAGNNLERAELLARCKSLSFVTETDINLKLNMVAEGASNVLKIGDNEGFLAFSKEVHGTQKPGGETPAGMKPESRPAAPTAVASAQPAPAQSSIPAQPALPLQPAGSEQAPLPPSDEGPVNA
jgi:hypothetical protein